MKDQNQKAAHFLDSIDENTEDLNVQNNNLEENQEEEEEENLDNEEFEEEQEEEEQQEEEEENQEEINDEFSYTPLVQELVKSGILSLIENKEYDDDDNGFKEIIDDNVLLKHQEFKDNLINETSKKFIEFLEAGGNPDEYIQKTSEIPDYANMNLEDETTLKNLIADHLFIQGYEEEDINTQIEEFEEIGSLNKQGKIAQKYLIKYAEKEFNKITEEQKENEKQRVDDLQKEAKSLHEFIYNSEHISGFKLAKTEKDRLYDYITKPIKKENGKVYTQNLLEDSIETKVATALFKMKKFNFKDIENKVETRKVNELHNNLKKKNDKLLGKNNVVNSEEQVNVSNVLKGFSFLER